MSQLIPTSENPNQYDGHILVVTCPLQGHVAPLMKLSHQITKFGIKVTFLTTEVTGERTTVSESWSQEVRILSIPVGGKDGYNFLATVGGVMNSYLEDLLKKTCRSPNSTSDSISGVIFDTSAVWMMEIAQKMGLKTATYWCSTPGCLGLGLKIPQIIDSGFIDNDGTPLKNESIKVLQNMPDMTTADLQWHFPADKDKQKSWFHLTKDIIHRMTNADWILCNWFHDLDPSAIKLTPKILSIGPLLANGQSTGSLCSEDSTCLAWLDKQPKNSVIYVAFGSTSRFSQQQLDELATGLELTGRPFLWVAWSGLTNGSSSTYSKAFAERVGDRGKIVEWAPQEAVLGHPATACFITHCGWGSFLESLSMGVPLLCWPYFGDQMYTEKCISDAWKVGMRLKSDDHKGVIVSGHDIKHKVEQLLSDGTIRENALKWKKMARESIKKGGSSFVNLEYLIQQMKYS